VDFRLGAKDIATKLEELTTLQTASAEGATLPTKVLIVEDERIVALSLENRLRGLGYEVVACVGSGEAAVEVAASTLPEVVLMDIHLAGSMRGTEAARLIWERLQVPVVYVTAYADAATLDEIKATEHYGYIVKPFRSVEIHAAIQLAINRRR